MALASASADEKHQNTDLEDTKDRRFLGQRGSATSTSKDMTTFVTYLLDAINLPIQIRLSKSNPPAIDSSSSSRSVSRQIIAGITRIYNIADLTSGDSYGRALVMIELALAS
jgi:hypothetical protein